MLVRSLELIFPRKMVNMIPSPPLSGICSAPSSTFAVSKPELNAMAMEVNRSNGFQQRCEDGLDHAAEAECQQAHEPLDRSFGICDDRVEVTRSRSAPPMQINETLPRKSCLKKPDPKSTSTRRRQHRGRRKTHRGSFDKMLCNLSHLAGSLGSSNSSASRASYLRSSSIDLSNSHTSDKQSHKRGSQKSSGSGETAVEVANVRFDSVLVCEYVQFTETDNNTDVEGAQWEQSANRQSVRSPLFKREPQGTPGIEDHKPRESIGNFTSCSVEEFEGQRQDSKRVKDTRLTIAQRKFLLFRQGFTEAEVEEVIVKQRAAQQRRKNILEQMREQEEKQKKPKAKKQLWGKVLSPLLAASIRDQTAKSTKARKRRSL